MLPNTFLLPDDDAVFGLRQDTHIPDFVKPPMPGVDVRLIEAAAPALKRAPLASIKRTLSASGLPARMMTGLQETIIFPPKADASSVRIDLSGLSPVGMPPTHVLDLRNDEGEFDSWLPCHALPLIIYCAKIPSMVNGSPLRQALPVVRLSLPSPETFPIIRDYTYTRSRVELMSALLPAVEGMPCVVAEDNDLDMGDKAVTVHATMTDAELSIRVERVHGVYLSACKLAISDTQLWVCLRLAREILVKAFALKRSGDDGDGV